MTKEEKELLLRDLCSRLAYRTFVQTYRCNTGSFELLMPRLLEAFIKDEGLEIKPYLRPISSMMQGEWEEMTALIYPYGRVNLNNKNELLLWLSIEGNDMPIMFMDNVFSWLDKNMFDYRGLIPMGLALEAPKNMYKI